MRLPQHGLQRLGGWNYQRMSSREAKQWLIDVEIVVAIWYGKYWCMYSCAFDSCHHSIQEVFKFTSICGYNTFKHIQIKLLWFAPHMRSNWLSNLSVIFRTAVIVSSPFQSAQFRSSTGQAWHGGNCELGTRTVHGKTETPPSNPQDSHGQPDHRQSWLVGQTPSAYGPDTSWYPTVAYEYAHSLAKGLQCSFAEWGI